MTIQNTTLILFLYSLNTRNCYSNKFDLLTTFLCTKHTFAEL